eukprot:241176_1
MDSHLNLLKNLLKGFEPEPTSSNAAQPTIILNIETISSDIEIALCCGFSREQLTQILTVVNNQIPDRSALKLKQLFLSLVVWRHNISYPFARVLFGYNSIGSIAYNLN